MILYLDTSAILKRYFQEPFSGDVDSKWSIAEAVVSSGVAYAETMATIYRKGWEASLESREIQEARDTFRADWNGLIRVEATSGLNPYIDQVLQRHFLRGFDAIHLASALIIHERFPGNFFFACFDQRLNQAAKLEKMATFDDSQEAEV